MSINIADTPTMLLRFPVGTRVECNCGTWKPGTVIKHFYAQKSFPEGMCVPYQVQCDDGKKIFAPRDVDAVIRELEVVPLDDFDEDVPESEKTPVTVITGFLGSGKTTLINHILTNKTGEKVCVIENEFGSVDIDTSLVQENLDVAEEIISLDNGCACCTVRGDLVKALTKLSKRRKDFDLIILETTGMANPARIILTRTRTPSFCLRSSLSPLSLQSSLSPLFMMLCFSPRKQGSSPREASRRLNVHAGLHVGEQLPRRWCSVPGGLQVRQGPYQRGAEGRHHQRVRDADCLRGSRTAQQNRPCEQE